MVFGISLEASLHGVLKQLFVMTQTSKGVEILQVVKKYYCFLCEPLLVLQDTMID